MPGYLAGGRVISYPLEQRWLESFQAHFSIGGCQLAGAEALRRRGFDSSAIAAMASCPPEPAAAGTPRPHLHCPPVPAFAPGLPPSPPDAVPETLHRLNLKAPGDAVGRWEVSLVNRKVLHPSTFLCIWVSLWSLGDI